MDRTLRDHTLNGDRSLTNCALTMGACTYWNIYEVPRSLMKRLMRPEVLMVEIVLVWQNINYTKHEICLIEMKNYFIWTAYQLKGWSRKYKCLHLSFSPLNLINSPFLCKTVIWVSKISSFSYHMIFRWLILFSYPSNKITHYFINPPVLIYLFFRIFYQICWKLSRNTHSVLDEMKYLD